MLLTALVKAPMQTVVVTEALVTRSRVREHLAPTARAAAVAVQDVSASILQLRLSFSER